MNSVPSTSGQQKLILLGILLLGMAIRTASWWLQGFKGGEKGTFPSMARFIAQGDWSAYLSSERPHQPIYTLLLTPKWMFNLDLAAYTFVLHALLACGTIYVVYTITRSLFGMVCGLISALLVAVNLMIAKWFPYDSGDIPFHFFLALFTLCSVRAWEQRSLRSILTFLLSGLLCILSRPEGLFVAVVASAILMYRTLYNYLPRWTTIVLILAAIVSCAAVLATTLYYNTPVREAVLSNVHVAYPLYTSTRTVTSSPAEESALYSSMGVVIDRAGQQPGFVSSNYALAMEGLRFIRANPLTWSKMYVLRLTSIVFPSVFSPWWSVKNRIYSFSVSVVLVVGSLIGCFLRGTNRFQAVGVTLLGLTIAFTISLYQREMDYRVPVSMQVVFACVAPFGWLGAFRFFAKRHSRA